MTLKWIILEIFEVICTPNFVYMLDLLFSNIFSKNSMKIACCYDFLRKNQFLPIFYKNLMTISQFSIGIKGKRMSIPILW